MTYFVRIHFSSSLVEGYIERSDLQKLEAAYRSKSPDVVHVALRNRMTGDAEITNLVITPTTISAIETIFKG